MLKIDKKKLALAGKRIGKAAAAAAVAVVVAHLPEVADAVGGQTVVVAVLTPLLLGLEKFLQK